MDSPRQKITTTEHTLTYLEEDGSFKSARDRLKKAASSKRRDSLRTMATDDLLADLDEILISSSSYTLIAMSHINPLHRKPNDIFMINLKMKLHLELFPPDNCPKCACGLTIDPFAKHIFSCCRVSKMVFHNQVRDGCAPVLKDVLATAGFPLVQARGWTLSPSGSSLTFLAFVLLIWHSAQFLPSSTPTFLHAPLLRLALMSPLLPTKVIPLLQEQVLLQIIHRPWPRSTWWRRSVVN